MLNFNDININNFKEILNEILERKYLNKQFIQLTKQNQSMDCILIETLLAEIMLDTIKINPEYCEKINIWIIKGIYGYISVDPTFSIKVNGLENQVSYIYNGINIIGRLPLDPHPQIISNFSFLHDIIFGYVLKQYEFNQLD